MPFARPRDRNSELQSIGCIIVTSAREVRLDGISVIRRLPSGTSLFAPGRATQGTPMKLIRRIHDC
jgi:hypothetical protein